MSGWQEGLSLAAALVLSGFFTTVIVQVLKNAKWPSWLKAALSVVVSILVGAAQVWVSGDLLGLIPEWGEWSSAQVISVVVAAWVGATAYYKLWFKGKPWMATLERWIWGAE